MILEHDPDRPAQVVGTTIRSMAENVESLDLFESKDLPSHRHRLAHDIAILEGLVLRGVPDGSTS